VLERLAEPSMDAESDVVRVDYTLRVIDEETTREVIRETHNMRYLFTPEVKMMLAANDLQLLASREWLSDREPCFDSWNVCHVARG